MSRHTSADVDAARHRVPNPPSRNLAGPFFSVLVSGEFPSPCFPVSQTFGPLWCLAVTKYVRDFGYVDTNSHAWQLVS